MSYRADKLVIDTHTHTDPQTQAMTIPDGQNWPRVKTKFDTDIIVDEYTSMVKNAFKS